MAGAVHGDDRVGIGRPRLHAVSVKLVVGALTVPTGRRPGRRCRTSLWLPASVDADQLTWTEVGDVASAVTLPGVVGDPPVPEPTV